MRNSKDFGTLPPLDFKNQGGSVDSSNVRVMLDGIKLKGCTPKEMTPLDWAEEEVYQAKCELCGEVLMRCSGKATVGFLIDTHRSAKSRHVCHAEPGELGPETEGPDHSDEVLAEVARADMLHGPFPTIQHAAAVLRREEQEAWAEVWNKPVNRLALRMELLHVEASARRFIRLLDEDPTMPKHNAKG